MQYYIKTFGCQMNKSESERIATILESIGYSETEKIEEADLVTLNTCAIRKPAEDRVFSLLHRCKTLKRKNPNMVVAVTGCMFALHQKKLKSLSDVCFNIKDLEKLPDMVNGLCRPNHNSINNFVDYLEVRPKRKSSTHAYVPIMSGCDNFCSFCVVPYTRGREASRPSEEIISEIKELVKKGYKAFTLIGQNVNSYGKNLPENTDFPALIEKIAAIKGDFWIWYVSSHPKDMSEKLIQLHKTEPKLCNYVHFAVQSGSNRILKAMNRHYTYDHCIELTKRIQKTVPEVMISTDIIVGFPGETKEDFKDTKKLCEAVGFEMVYLGRYSRRPNTRAYHMEETVSWDEKAEREHEIMKVVEAANLKNNKALEEKTVKVLVDKQVLTTNRSKNTPHFMGKTSNFKTVKFTSDKEINTGDFIEVKITKGLNWGLEGIST